jgi:hypothetical protein
MSPSLSPLSSLSSYALRQPQGTLHVHTTENGFPTMEGLVLTSFISQMPEWGCHSKDSGVLRPVKTFGSFLISDSFCLQLTSLHLGIHWCCRWMKALSSLCWHGGLQTSSWVAESHPASGFPSEPREAGGHWVPHSRTTVPFWLERGPGYHLGAAIGWVSQEGGPRVTAWSPIPCSSPTRAAFPGHWHVSTFYEPWHVVKSAAAWVTVCLLTLMGWWELHISHSLPLTWTLAKIAYRPGLQLSQAFFPLEFAT